MWQRRLLTTRASRAARVWLHEDAATTDEPRGGAQKRARLLYNGTRPALQSLNDVPARTARPEPTRDFVVAQRAVVFNSIRISRYSARPVFTAHSVSPARRNTVRPGVTTASRGDKVESGPGTAMIRSPATSTIR